MPGAKGMGRTIASTPFFCALNYRTEEARVETKDMRIIFTCLLVLMGVNAFGGPRVNTKRLKQAVSRALYTNKDQLKNALQRSKEIDQRNKTLFLNDSINRQRVLKNLPNQNSTKKNKETPVMWQAPENNNYYYQPSNKRGQ